MNGPQKRKRGLAVVGGLGQLPTPKACATAEAWGKKPHFYKPLPTRFPHDGFDYRLIAREGDAAITIGNAKTAVVRRHGYSMEDAQEVHL
jgi:hypothetical protein